MVIFFHNKRIIRSNVQSNTGLRKETKILVFFSCLCLSQEKEEYDHTLRNDASE